MDQTQTKPQSFPVAPAQDSAPDHECSAAEPAAETALIQRVLSGDKDAFITLTAPYHGQVFAAAMAVLNNREDAEECAQESLLKAWTHLASFRGGSRFSTWLIQIAINEARMRLRKYRRSRYDSIDETFASGDGEIRQVEIRDPRPSPVYAVANASLRQEIGQALASLAPMYRKVFELRAVQDISTEATAEWLGISEAAVKTRLRRARQQMRKRLEPAWGRYWMQCFPAPDQPQMV